MYIFIASRVWGRAERQRAQAASLDSLQLGLARYYLSHLNGSIWLDICGAHHVSFVVHKIHAVTWLLLSSGGSCFFIYFIFFSNFQDFNLVGGTMTPPIEGRFLSFHVGDTQSSHHRSQISVVRYIIFHTLEYKI